MTYNQIMHDQQWYWEYLPAVAQWHLHTPCYEPEVSFKVGVHEGSVVAAFHKRTNIPQEVKEVLSKMLPYLDLYAQSNMGITRVLIPGDQVISASKRVEDLKLVISTGVK